MLAPWLAERAKPGGETEEEKEEKRMPLSFSLEIGREERSLLLSLEKSE
jgi:hypothetical protein